MWDREGRDQNAMREGGGEGGASFGLKEGRGKAA